jgi:DnaD/phage-associated family protein
MKQFQGFPARMDFTPVPNVFFSGLLPQIDDMAELKTTLHVIAAIYRKKGSPRLVTFNELLGDAGLITSLKCGEEPAAVVLRAALKMASDRGTLIRVVLEGDGADEAYFLNDEPGRQTVAKINSGELKLPGFQAKVPAPVVTGELPDIFSLYEQNVGMLTPMIADELREAEKLYPPEWIRDAIKEAVLHNKRNIKYITKILENWSTEGRSDGTNRGDSEKAGPDKYFKGKYGHMVQR